jgi:hypothetical protein
MTSGAVRAAWIPFLLLTAACATRQPVVGQETRGADRKLSTFVYLEEGKIGTLLVGTRAAQYRRGDAYVPLEISVANRGLPQLTLTRESFTLVDDTGRRYPCAGPAELLSRYEFLDLDRRLQEIGEIVFNRFSAYTRYPSQFSPLRRGSSVPGTSTLVRDAVYLPRYGYIIDLLYFPMPEGGIPSGRRFELFLDAPEIDPPIYCTFLMP